MTKREGETQLYSVICQGCCTEMRVENPDQPPYCMPCFVSKKMQERYSVQKEYTFNENELLEKFAAICHDQWVYWSIAVFKRLISKPHTIEAGNVVYDRWAPNWIPYHELSEEIKELDRKYARKFLEVIKK